MSLSTNRRKRNLSLNIKSASPVEEKEGEVSFEDIPLDSPLEHVEVFYGHPTTTPDTQSSDELLSQENDDRSFSSEEDIPVIRESSFAGKNPQPTEFSSHEELNSLLKKQKAEFTATSPEIKKLISLSIKRDVETMSRRASGSSSLRENSSRAEESRFAQAEENEVFTKRNEIYEESDTPSMRERKMKISLTEEQQREIQAREGNPNRDFTEKYFEKIIIGEKYFRESEVGVMSKILNCKYWDGCTFSKNVENLLSDYLKKSELKRFF